MDRAVQTKQKVVDALDELLETHALEDVRVTELCSRCNISRSTFYRYFDDVSDVVVYYFEMVLTRAVLSETSEIDFFEERKRTISQLVLKKSLFTKSVMAKRFGPVMSRIAKMGDDSFRKRVERVHGHVLTREESTLLEYYGHFTICTFVKWLQDDDDITIEQLIGMLYKFFPSEFKQYLRG